ncbi:MAG: S8 family serine peptidase [Candidatus Thiodiazotropha sp. (ex Epidulcina cf. delphinae)]|nr:S8 family serine peptidase [Candidatus Thiodiazotropha sp. (ex Epidulcina cf. delphinae)]
MVDVAPSQPWSPDHTRRALRGRILLKMANDDGPRNAPHYLQTGVLAAPLHFDRGNVDRAIRRHSHAMQVTRAYQPSRAPLLGSPVANAWDNIEERIGLARTYRIDIDPDTRLLHLLDTLRGLSNVELATPHYLCDTPFELDRRYGNDRPADPFYAQNMVGVAEALGFEPGDRALQVGVVDSGVDLGHPELLAALRPGVDTVDLPTQILTGDVHLVGDSENPDRIPRDEIGHGTACASIIAATGQRMPKGLAGAAQLVPARALAGVRMLESNHLTAMGSLPDIDQAVKTLVDLGVRVLNLSFGTPASALRDDDPMPHQDIIEYALQRGCILVAASGNDGAFQRYFPAAHPEVLAVGSVNPRSEPSAFSTRGDHVLLCAPGEDVLAATLDGEYQENTGTSFAAPFVTGACALLLSRAARYGRPLDAATVKSFLSAYARPFAIGSDSRGCGAGVLDVPASLRGLERALSRAGDQWLPIMPLAARDSTEASR